MASAPIRVLWLVKGLGPGGAERLLVSLARAHDPSRVRIAAAYVLPWKDALVPELEAAGVETTCLGGSRGASDLRWVARVRQLIASGRFDVVHSHSPLVASAARLAVKTVPRRTRPALVTTEHNAWGTFAIPTRVLNAVTAPMDRASFAVSDHARSSMWWPSLRARTEVVVHGVDLAMFAAARRDRDRVREDLGAGREDVVIVTVANYRSQKAWPVLLAAARVVLDAEPSARFVGVGQGPLAEEIAREHRRLQLGDRFALLGRRDDVPRILAAADVFALASTYEGFPVAVMEALAAGLPVVSTAVGGVPDAVTDGIEGILVRPGAPEELAAEITRLVRDPATRIAMGRSAERRGRSFDIDKVALHLEARYRDLTPRISER